MSVVDEEESRNWRQQTQKKNRKRNLEKKLSCDKRDSEFDTASEVEKHIRVKHNEILWNLCDKCTEKFKTSVELQRHVLNAHRELIQHTCNKCNSIFKTKFELEEHIRLNHTEELRPNVMEIQEAASQYKCDKCDKVSKSGEEQREHIITMHADKVFNCQICNKPYTSMSLLRRHDWRCHRMIECNMCGEGITSRSHIKEHREVKHQISQKVFCKYYPNCLDGDECLFVHEVGPGGDSVCPEGEKCNNQSCNFSEQSHTKSKLLCIFQAKCNRLNCPFKHTVPRNAFLGESFKNNPIN